MEDRNQQNKQNQKLNPNERQSDQKHTGSQQDNPQKNANQNQPQGNQNKNQQQKH
jgi:hypothetical protein